MNTEKDMENLHAFEKDLKEMIDGKVKTMSVEEAIEELSKGFKYKVKIQYEFECDAEDEEDALQKAVGALITDAGSAIGRWLTGREETLKSALATYFDFEVRKGREVVLMEGNVLEAHLVDGQVVVQLGELPEGKTWADVAEAVVQEIMKKEKEQEAPTKTWFLLTGNPWVSMKAIYRNDISEGEKQSLGGTLLSYGMSLNPDYTCHEKYEEEDW